MVKPQLTIQLSDAQRIPQIGLGVWQASDEEARAAVRVALEEGYRHVDTASIYGNEKGVGEGLRGAGAPREQVFLTPRSGMTPTDSNRLPLHWMRVWSD